MNPRTPDDPPVPPDPWSSPNDELAWEGGVALLAAHPRFGPLVARVGPVRLPPVEPDPFLALARSIAYQQLAGKAAATIWRRVEAAAGDRVEPAIIRDLPDATLRGAGLSGAKLAALRDLSRRVLEGTLDLARLPALSDDEVMQALVAVRGIGPWTARMHLMFQLRRPDVWPVLDLAVRNGWARIHGATPAPDARALAPLGDPFRPWRSAVAWYCWRVMDAGLTELG
jgi:DNA-3-methyladenine glycosylase II